MEPKQLLEFAKIASTTYEDPKNSQKLFKAQGYNIEKFFDNNGAQGYLLKKENTYVLSFRGTQVQQTSDVIADLSTDKRSEKCGGQVHHGFKKELDKIWSSIEETLKETSSKLYITGHSLGAAMATIAASRLQSRVVALITFGSPRVGNQEFVDNVIIDHFRVQNNCDAVTTVPFHWLGFRHHGCNIYLDYSGKISKLSYMQKIKDNIKSRIKAMSKFQLFNGVFDHMMYQYINKLEKLTK